MSQSLKLPGLGRIYEETKRVARILEMISLIAARPNRFRRRDLAQRFEITERMIQKDLDVIRNGLKLELAPSQEGYHFVETPRLSDIAFSFPEALALVLAIQTARCNSGIRSVELEAAVSRLEALFPPQFTSHIRRLGLNERRPVTGKNRRKMITLLHRALLEGSKVRMLYKSSSRGGAETERTVYPYYIMPYVRSWHLIAHCELREKVLTFKVDRIAKAVLLTERYNIPSDFRLEDYVGDAWGLMSSKNEEAVHVELLFEPEAGRWVAEEYWHKSQQIETLADGRVKFRLFLPTTPDFLGWILYYGWRVEVIQPFELRERVAAEHRKAADQYLNK